MLTLSPMHTDSDTSINVPKFTAVRDPIVNVPPGAVRSSIGPYLHISRVREPISMRPSSR